MIEIDQSSDLFLAERLLARRATRDDLQLRRMTGLMRDNGSLGSTVQRRQSVPLTRMGVRHTFLPRSADRPAMSTVSNNLSPALVGGLGQGRSILEATSFKALP
jgi:hypothetical protein